MQGAIDLVTPEGVVEGWCWDERSPDTRVAVSIRVDGEEVGQTVANHFRDDLRAASIGDGGHAFKYIVPDEVLGRRRAQLVSVTTVLTREAVGEPQAIRVDWTRTFDDRITELEARNRALQAQVEALRQGQGRAELFAVVGAFFERVARDLARGTAPVVEQQLGEALNAARSAYPPVTFSAAGDPDIAIVVDGAHSLRDLHACLLALRRASEDVRVQVTIIDPATIDEVVLLPSVVHGVRYVRKVSDLVAEWADLVAGEISPVVLFLGGGMIVDRAFLTTLLDWFDANPRTACAGGALVGADGEILHGGLRLADGALVDDTATEASDGYAVDAVSHHVAAFRLEAVDEVGGLDATFGDDVGAATLDLCIRLRKADWAVCWLPGATVSCPAGLGTPWMPDPRTVARLAARWLTQPDL